MDGLLQPFVDDELTEEERKAVASYLDRNPEARQLVREQQEVKAALRDLELERAPNALRERILRELDAVDQEVAEASQDEKVQHIASASKDRPGSGLWSRLGALAKGGLLMVPAAAAAVTLFFVARAGEGPNLPLSVPGAHMDGEVALHLPRKTAAVADAESGAVFDGKGVIEDQFPIQVADRPDLPPNVELVSDHAANALATQVTVQYADRRGGFRLLDLQRPASDEALLGTRQVFRGQPYHLSRDAHDRPLVEFDHGGVRHHLTFAADGPQAPGPELDVEHPDFALLLEVADALRHR
jgi:hypothetical protein